MNVPLRVAIIGTGKRSDYLYGPLNSALPQDVQLVSIWGRSESSARMGHGVQWHDDEIGVASCLLSLVDAVRGGTDPSYGPHQARLDQEIILAIRMSAKNGGHPVNLPLDPAAQID